MIGRKTGCSSSKLSTCVRNREPIARGNSNADLLEQAAHLVLQIAADADQTGAGNEQRSDRLAVVALDPDLAIPTDPDQLGQPTGVVRIALVHSDRQCGVRVSSIDAHDGQINALKFVPKPTRHGAGFKTDPFRDRRALV